MSAVGSSGSAQGSGNDQGVGDGDPARSTSLRAADSKGPSSASVATTNQTETVKTDDMKKKKRRGKPQKKLTGNQREKRRREIQENGVGPNDSEPDWDELLIHSQMTMDEGVCNSSVKNCSSGANFYANDADELERYGFFKKSKARVAKHDDQSKHENVKERIWINPVTSEMTLQPLEQDTDTPSCTMSVS